MPKAALRVQSFAISIDGYGAGLSQDLQNPLGVRGPELMEWFLHTRVWRKMHGHDDGETGVDNGIAEQGFAGIGAWILGRRSGWREVRSFALSPKAFTPPWSRRALQRTAATSASAAAYPLSGSIC